MDDGNREKSKRKVKCQLFCNATSTTYDNIYEHAHSATRIIHGDAKRA